MMDAPADAKRYSMSGIPELQMVPRKIFVGSLPDGLTDPILRAEFSKYGEVVDLFMKSTGVPQRHWAFITFATSEQAQFARNSCDKILMFPGSEKPCEVSIARHQSMFGKDLADSGSGGCSMEAPRKVFVGSLPDCITDAALRSEFSKYGQIIDVFLKTNCESGRQWAFIIFATTAQAQYAKDSTDRLLTFPGADRACQVMLAKNQGKFGHAPLPSYGGPGSIHGAVPQDVAVPLPTLDGQQPPPPTAPPPAHLTPWRMYKTASGLPYYHNASTGATQWECPPDFQVPGQPEALSAAVMQQAQAGVAGCGGMVQSSDDYGGAAQASAGYGDMVQACAGHGGQTQAGACYGSQLQADASYSEAAQAGACSSEQAQAGVCYSEQSQEEAVCDRQAQADAFYGGQAMAGTCIGEQLQGDACCGGQVQARTCYGEQAMAGACYSGAMGGQPRFSPY